VKVAMHLDLIHGTPSEKLSSSYYTG